MSDPSDALSDLPKFDRQRRNVLSASLTLIVVRLAGFEVSKFKLFDAKITHPFRIELIWSFVIAYFVLRMHQFRHEIKDQKKALWAAYFTPIYDETMRRYSFRYRALKEMIDISIRNTPHDEIRLMSVARVDSTISMRFHPYYSGGPQSVGSEFRDEKFKYGRILWFWAKFKTSAYVFLNTPYFTEYVLPYWCGAIALAIVVIDLIIKIK